MTADEKKRFVIDTWRDFHEWRTEAALANFSPDVSFVINADLPGIARLNSGYQPLRDVTAAGQQFFSGPGTLEVESALCDNDTVILEYTLRAPLRTGEAYVNRYCVFFTVIQDKVTEIREYCDTQRIMQVFFK